MTTSPDLLPATRTPEHSTPLSPQELLHPDAIGDLRDKQWQALADKIRPYYATNETELKAASNEFYWTDLREMNQSFLNDGGIAADDPKRDLYSDLVARYSIQTPAARMSASSDGKDYGDSWKINPNVDTDGNPKPSDRELYEAEWKDIFGLDTESTPAAPTEFEAASNKLAELRSTFADMSAKRQGRFFSREKSDFMEKYRETEKQYKLAQATFGKLELEKHIAENPGIEESQVDLKIAQLYLTEQMTMRRESVEKLENKKVSKFINAITSGSKIQRLAKNAAIGLVAGGVAAGITVVTGGVGAGIAGAILSTAVTTITRAAKGYARADAKQGRGMERVLNAKQILGLDSAITSESGDHTKKIEAAINKGSQLFEDDTKNEQNKHKRSGAITFGYIAVGATIGGLIAHAMDARDAAPEPSFASTYPVDGSGQGMGAGKVLDERWSIPAEAQPDTASGIDAGTPIDDGSDTLDVDSPASPAVAQPEIAEPATPVVADTEQTGAVLKDLLPSSGEAAAEGSTEFINPADLPKPDGFANPWQWASNAYGAEQAMAKLESLAQLSAEQGHQVEWHGSGINRWLEIDGKSDAQSVLTTLISTAK